MEQTTTGMYDYDEDLVLRNDCVFCDGFASFYILILTLTFTSTCFSIFLRAVACYSLAELGLRVSNIKGKRTDMACGWAEF